MNKRYLVAVTLIALAAIFSMAVFWHPVTAWAAPVSDTVLIDKTHPLQPVTYLPPNLVVPRVRLAEPANSPEMELAPVTATALTQLFQAAHSNGLELILSSGYRSYGDQAVLYAKSLMIAGAASADAVALPGYSEHQTGLAADIATSDGFCEPSVVSCYILTRAAAWLSVHAYQYGFVVRYPLHQESSTGYQYEPWHLRYVGPALAHHLASRGETLEEYYGLL